MPHPKKGSDTKLKNYWQQLVTEVQHGQQRNPRLSVGEPAPKHQSPHNFSPYPQTSERRSAKYTLGEPLAPVYFTQREAECMMQLLQGNTMNQTGDILHLSPRTVEYYLTKVKRKLNCRKKRELIQLVSKTDFAKNFQQDPYNQKD